MYYYFFLLLVALIPLRNIVLKTIHVFDTSGLNIVNVLYALALLGALLAPRGKKEETYSSKVLLPLTLYVFYFFLQIFFQPGDHSFTELLKWWKDCFLFMLIPYLFVTRAITDKKKIFILLGLMCVVNLYMDIYFWRWVRWMNFDSFADKMKSVNGTFGDVGGCNEWAAFFSTYTLVLFAVAKTVSKKWINIGLKALATSNVFVLLFTFSRGGYLGFLVGVSYMLLKTKKYAFIILLLCLPLFYSTILPSSVVERINMSFETTEYGATGDQDVASRLEMWKHSLAMISESPLFGHGLLSFRHGYWRNPHNQHLNIMVQGGLFGYALFFWIFVAAFKDASHLIKNGSDSFYRALGLGVCAAIVSLFCANLFGDRWSYYVLSGYFWVLVGCVSVFTRLSDMQIK